MKLKMRSAFTLVEIMIVVAIIGILSAVAVPNFVKSRETALKNACIENLHQIQGAVQRWAIDTVAASNAAPTTADIAPDYLRTWPKEGTREYPVPGVSDLPVCPNSAVKTDHRL